MDGSVVRAQPNTTDNHFYQFGCTTQFLPFLWFILLVSVLLLGAFTSLPAHLILRGIGLSQFGGNDQTAITRSKREF